MAGYINVHWALFTGFCSGCIGYLGCSKVKQVIGYDDTLDVFGIHGLVGIFGGLALAFFIDKDINHNG